MGLTGRIWTAGGVVLVLLALPAVSAPQPAAGETAEPVLELEADQQGAVAGEAPPAAAQSTPTRQKPAELPRATAPRERSPRSVAKDGPADAAEHLARVEAIVREALDATRGDEPPEDEEPIGTTGTPLTAETGEVVTIERATLEEIRLHLEQIRTALAGHPR